MSKKKNKRPPQRAARHSEAARPAPPSPQPAKGLAAYVPSQAALRELIEMVATAFVLAFLFRTFEAEAFVIPTGSMATTLMGRHKDVVCPNCGYPYQVSASEEVDNETGAPKWENGQLEKVVDGVCPMCRYEKTDMRQEKSFNGDRILVNKFAYQFSDPRRFDVAVFHCPGEARTNYVKRITGLPGETIRIEHGDLFVKKEGQDEFQIARKPPGKLRAMLRTVYDNDYVLPEKPLARRWPARWQPEDVSGGWTTSEDHKSFSASLPKDAQAWLRYHHVVPQPGLWRYSENRPALPPDGPPPERLISDDCEYNSNVLVSGKNPPEGGLGFHWVGDLAIACTLDARSGSGLVFLELVEGGRRMLCQLELASGQATLSISDLQEFACSGQTALRGPGSHEILFANADDQLRLWVDGRLVAMDKPTTYPPLGNHTPTEADLRPAGIAARGADVEVRHLRVLRDTYYIADRQPPVSDFVDPGAVFGVERPQDIRPEDIAVLLSDPARYARAARRSEEFSLGKDQFLALGDNSARSNDSRLWTSGHFVHRDLLIGQALYLYWPHSWNKITLGGAKIPFPYFPNFKNMGFVR